MSGMSSSQQQQQQQHLQYLGDTSAALPDFGRVILSPGEQFPRGVTAEHVVIFEHLYREHCEVSYKYNTILKLRPNGSIQIYHYLLLLLCYYF